MSGAASPAPVRAVLLDALGTLIGFDPPWPALQRELRERFALEVSLADAKRAMKAEIAYYREHHDEAVDRASLARLRRACAAVLRDALPPPAAALGLEPLTEALLAAVRFRAFPDAPAALRGLRARGAALVVVSNWDVSLHDALEQTGLTPLLDAALSSAEVGAAKPDRAIFRRALAVAGVDAHEAVHVGDSWREDVEGARGAGIRPLLVARDGPRPAGVEAVATLGEVQDALKRPAYP